MTSGDSANGPGEKARTGSVRLRDVTAADSASLYRWRMDPSSRPMFRSTAPVSLEAHEAFLAGYLSRSTTARDRWLVIEADGSPVGAIALYGFSADGSEAEWGRLVLEPAARGRGYGKRALELLLERARELGVRRLRCEVVSGNVPAERIYEELGFVETDREKVDGRVFRYLARDLR